MRGLIKLYEEAIKELEKRIETYTNYAEAEEEYSNSIEVWEKIGFLKGKKEALEEVLEGRKVINMYVNSKDD